MSSLVGTSASLLSLLSGGAADPPCRPDAVGRRRALGAERDALEADPRARLRAARLLGAPLRRGIDDLRRDLALGAARPAAGVADRARRGGAPLRQPGDVRLRAAADDRVDRRPDLRCDT